MKTRFSDLTMPNHLLYSPNIVKFERLCQTSIFQATYRQYEPNTKTNPDTPFIVKRTENIGTVLSDNYRKFFILIMSAHPIIVIILELQFLHGNSYGRQKNAPAHYMCSHTHWFHNKPSSLHRSTVCKLTTHPMRRAHVTLMPSHDPRDLLCFILYRCSKRLSKLDSSVPSYPHFHSGDVCSATVPTIPVL
jgi:hypothetical protein